ncbi:uncharacterized protein At4g10930 isoform X1 [Amborella trichopoda]|nr:uncharacterized protein At4g10930 isoform X1 [Amborella trichopoda]XP_020527856.1 uncharacterized protein At4g10930 isoform X1 [Amborella trichopoda]|eukprot:XP_011626307.2 uncharacterized protein At4g10930 isoform X1 [Amborella trichopoda]
MMDSEEHEFGKFNEAGYEVQEDLDDDVSEYDRCGICMDLIIDRGVLDCCKHWFCFACIDNWATITNLCPLCKNEFQLITCVPVYDTIGSITHEENSLVSKDNDWCIQGKSNTLSFPSYYIDEDAVICLDGDGCKIRSGLASTEEASTLETSIACDSCDIWYHAFCVGFDPETTSETSWLCPRCKTDEATKQSGVSGQHLDTKFEEDNIHLSEADFSRMVSVSIADYGETAVVVSMVDGKQWTGVNENLEKILADTTRPDKENGPSSVDLNADILVKPELKLLDELDSREALNSSLICPDTREMARLIQENLGNDGTGHKVSLENTIHPEIDIQRNTLSPSGDLSLSSASDLLHISDFISKTVNTGRHIQGSPDRCEILLPQFDNTCCTKIAESSQCESSIDLHLDLAMGSSHLSGDMMSFHENEDILVEERNQRSNKLCGAKRRNVENARDSVEVEAQTDGSKKKSRLVGKSGCCQDVKSELDGSNECLSHTKSLGYHKLSPSLMKEASPTDIMSIVQRSDLRSIKGKAPPSATDGSTKETVHGTGLRVKKIMRRGTDDKEASILVQKIRKEISVEVLDKTLINSDKNDQVEARLLSAFRAAIVRPNSAEAKTVNPSIIAKHKKMLLQKGTVRENLTKKLYGTGSGRRRHAWDRDWEIEFWKHRCFGTKSEKVETLQSVLELLRKSCDSKDSKVEKKPEGETANPIFSRLYLADASLFPRKDDIKPLSVMSDCGMKTLPAENKEHDLNTRTAKVPKQGAGTSIPNSNAGNKSTTQSCKVQSNHDKLPVSDINKGQSNSIIKDVGKSDDVKSDKKKWALEVLARKTAKINNGDPGKQDDVTGLKGTFPLLAQLPSDMRPTLAATRHSKVPIAVRQMQLNCLIEHFLRKADLPIIRRTAETELAVADAVNIEKEIYGRSNSKIVYVNLCAQALSQHSSANQRFKTEKTIPNPKEEIKEIPEGDTSDAALNCDVQRALKEAGLVDDDDDSDDDQEKNCENVLELDSHAEMDIYGDFDYDLEDEDFIFPSSIVSSSRESKLRKEDGDLKMKVVLSTPCSEKTVVKNPNSGNGALRDVMSDASLGDHKTLATHEPKNIEVNKIRGSRSSATGLETAKTCQLSETDIELKEPSLAECEELYGKEEPILNQFIVDTSSNRSEFTGKPDATIGKVSIDEITEKYGATHYRSFTDENSEPIISRGLTTENVPVEESRRSNDGPSNRNYSVWKKVEAYIKEHIRPLCKSGVITVEHYRWAATKATHKVMRYHCKAKNADFLIKEGQKIKKLADEYVQTAKQKKDLR